MLPKLNRISSSFDIRRLQRLGKHYHFPLLNLTISKNALDHSRFVFIVPKKLDKRAVRRNRTKRLLREAVHALLPEIAPGYEVGMYARRILGEEKLENIILEINESFRKAGLIG